MNRWAQFLAEVPPTLHRLIARSQRISLPRGCSATERQRIVRLALCRASAVRATYFALPPDAQAALQQLRECPRGLTPAELTAHYGPIRPWSVIADDRAPQSLSERLILLGWLLPRPATPRHPLRYLLAPELRAWLPRPLALSDLGAAPPSPPAPVLRAAASILLACAAHPLPLRADGTLTSSSLRTLLPRLVPLDQPHVAALCGFVVPLLVDLGLLAPHGAAAALAPAGLRFLALPAAVQLERLRAAWLRAPREDAWLRPLLITTRGLDWPLLRRRLLAWAAALPQGRLLDPTTLFPSLVASLGPLADAQTHGFRTVERAPWQDKRAAMVWDVALRGPLAWLGVIAWVADDLTTPMHCYATEQARAALAMTNADADAAPRSQAAYAPSSAWRYGVPGEVSVPHDAVDADVVGLLAYARWQGADATSTTYQISARSVATAVRDGHSPTALRALLERRAGALPDTWQPLFEVPAQIRVLHTTVVLSDVPAVLDRAAQQRSVRRYLTTRLAPGIALAEPARTAALVRALERQDLAVEVRGDPTIAPPQAFSPAERALLLETCAAYRAHPAEGARLPALLALEERLRAGLPAALLPAPPAPDATAVTLVRSNRVTAPAARPGVPAVPLAPGRPAHAVPPLHATPRSSSAARYGTRGQPMGAGVLLAFWSALWIVLLAVFSRAIAFSPAAARHLLSRARETSKAQRAGWSGGEGEMATISTSDPPAPVLNLAAAPAPSTSAPVSVATWLSLLGQAIRGRRLVRIEYTAAQAAAPTERVIRPLRLEGHGERWYLHAYCTLAQAERLFRLDRISALALLDRRARATPAGKSGPRRTSARRTTVSSDPLGALALPERAAPVKPRVGFFPAPPAPPPNSPLVRIWLEE